LWFGLWLSTIFFVISGHAVRLMSVCLDMFRAGKGMGGSILPAATGESALRLSLLQPGSSKDGVSSM